MEKRALILQGGWDGHEPQLTSKRFAGLLREAGFQVEISDTLESLANLEELMRRGMLWAAQGRQFARQNGLTTERFENTAKMY